MIKSRGTKRLVIAALMSGLLAGAACAQTSAQTTAVPATAPQTTAAPSAQSAGGAPDNPDQCLKAASDLAQSAEERKLGEAQLDRIEDLLTKMESHCDAKQFVEAMSVGNDIKTLIETR